MKYKRYHQSRTRKTRQFIFVCLFLAGALFSFLIIYKPHTFAAIPEFQNAYLEEKLQESLTYNLTSAYKSSTNNMLQLGTKQDLENLIRFQCLKLKCNADQIIRVMNCESRGQIRATNGVHKGIFQHNERFWPDRAKKYGVPNYDIYDPYAQIIVSTNMFADGLSSHWECK